MNAAPPQPLAMEPSPQSAAEMPAIILYKGMVPIVNQVPRHPGNHKSESSNWSSNCRCYSLHNHNP